MYYMLLQKAYMNTCTALIFLQMILRKKLETTQTFYIIHSQGVAIFPCARARVCVCVCVCACMCVQL